jgi:hypothetical protein
MTLDEAVSAFQTRLKFGDPKQIEAVGVMALAALEPEAFERAERQEQGRLFE